MKPWIVLLFVVLVSACTAPEQIYRETEAVENTTEFISSFENQNAVDFEIENSLLLLEQQMQSATKSGEISPQTYAEIDKKIKDFESKGANQTRIQSVRALLSTLRIGSQEAPRNESNPAEQSANETTRQTTKESTGPVRWEYMFDEKRWVTADARNPPACPEPFTVQTPIDLSKVSSILYPGQVRGGQFKPHGGFRTDDAGTSVTMVAPFDGYVWQGARFYDENGIHYLLDIQHECGIMYRMGHIAELSPELQEVAETLPLPVERGDSRTTRVTQVFFVKKGDLIAVRSQANTGYDWGVYDLRETNEAANDADFREKYAQISGQAYHGMCWFSWLNSEDEKKVRALPSSDGKMGKTSDYC